MSSEKRTNASPVPTRTRQKATFDYYEKILRKALEERRQWVTSSMVAWLLREQANHAESYWRIMYSFLFPSDENIISGDNRNNLTHGRYHTRSGHIAITRKVYYLWINERSVTHYMPCIIAPRNKHRHSQPSRSTRGFSRSSGRQRYDDSDEDRDAPDILHWYCPVCEKTVTDEYYASAYEGLKSHLTSPCHDHMRHEKGIRHYHCLCMSDPLPKFFIDLVADVPQRLKKRLAH